MTDVGLERRLLATQGLDIDTRETWEAVQDYSSERTVLFPAEGFFLHISVTIDHGDLSGDEHADMRTIERIGQERFGIGFPYNAAVFDTGRLYEGQPLTRRGAHTVNDRHVDGFREYGDHWSLNWWYRALVLPQMEADDVTAAQIDVAARWAAAQIRAGLAKPGARWYGHRDVAYKACPGDTGYERLPELNELTRHYEAAGLEEDTLTPELKAYLDGQFQALHTKIDRVAEEHDDPGAFRIKADDHQDGEPILVTDLDIDAEVRVGSALDNQVKLYKRLGQEDDRALIWPREAYEQLRAILLGDDAPVDAA